jgi:hypothetical protein
LKFRKTRFNAFFPYCVNLHLGWIVLRKIPIVKYFIDIFMFIFIKYFIKKLIKKIFYNQSSNLNIFKKKLTYKNL